MAMTNAERARRFRARHRCERRAEECPMCWQPIESGRVDRMTCSPKCAQRFKRWREGIRREVGELHRLAGWTENSGSVDPGTAAKIAADTRGMTADELLEYKWAQWEATYDDRERLSKIKAELRAAEVERERERRRKGQPIPGL